MSLSQSMVAIKEKITCDKIKNSKSNNPKLNLDPDIKETKDIKNIQKNIKDDISINAPTINVDKLIINENEVLELDNFDKNIEVKEEGEFVIPRIRRPKKIFSPPFSQFQNSSPLSSSGEYSLASSGELSSAGTPKNITSPVSPWKKKKWTNFDDDMRWSAGGLIFNLSMTKMVLVFNRWSMRWSIPKGHSKKWEKDPKQTAIREVHEETGLSTKLLTEGDWPSMKINRTIYHIAVSDESSLCPMDTKEILDCRWVKLESIRNGIENLEEKGDLKDIRNATLTRDVKSIPALVKRINKIIANRGCRDLRNGEILTHLEIK